MCERKYTYEEVEKIYNNLGYELIDEIHINYYSKYTIKDKDGFYYLNVLDNLLMGKTPRKYHPSNPYTIYNIKLWVNINNKPFELISDTYENNIKNLKWKCLIDDCSEEFEADWAHIQRGHGCTYCPSQKLGLSNCLATKNPELAKQWHPTKNGDLTPYDVFPTHKEHIWWQCSKNPKHEWHCNVNDRHNKKTGCPYCAGFYPSEDYNLLVCNPKLCEEWDYKKNDKRPEDYTPGSGEYAWWKCKECNHSWYIKINNRNHKNGSGCPECNKSKGEKKIDEILINKSWIKISQEEFDKLIDKDKYNKNYYIPQMKFKRLIGTGGGLLSYDFYIPKLNLLIEYDGEFHFRLIKLYKNEPIKNAEERYKKQCVHDILKNKYAMDNNIQLIRIPYWDFDNIEKYLDYYLKEEFLLAS